MSAERRVVVSWSGGKDAAWALHELRHDPAVEVVGLLTTVNAAWRRAPRSTAHWTDFAAILRTEAD